MMQRPQTATRRALVVEPIEPRQLFCCSDISGERSVKAMIAATLATLVVETGLIGSLEIGACNDGETIDTLLNCLKEIDFYEMGTALGTWPSVFLFGSVGVGCFSFVYVSCAMNYN